MVGSPRGRQAWGGQPGWCPARQQPRYQPAPSQACPALGRPEPNSPVRWVSGQHQEKRGRTWLRALHGGVREAALTLSSVSLLDPALRASGEGLELPLFCKWRCLTFLGPHRSGAGGLIG